MALAQQHGIIVTLQETNGELTLHMVGMATLPKYQQVLRQVTFDTNSSDATIRNIDIELHDGAHGSIAPMTTVQMCAARGSFTNGNSQFEACPMGKFQANTASYRAPIVPRAHSVIAFSFRQGSAKHPPRARSTTSWL